MKIKIDLMTLISIIVAVAVIAGLGGYVTGREVGVMLSEVETRLKEQGISADLSVPECQ